MRTRIALALAAGAVAATSVMPATPAAAAETCHPPNYDTVRCACEAVGRVWIWLTGGQWMCP
jgi:hypothetical protein